ncbi:PAS domain-containing protein [Kordiimonas lipolytica]|uniref:PAS domain-containing protein n=1 Tax=Kordiimonas lipolytica TaxID=1662421 RepID=A0ABV8UEY8_9PROT|nr:PAS domain-containing protein [Kordiimonas lipolytica]
MTTLIVSLPPAHEKLLKYYRGLMQDAGGAIPQRSAVHPSDIKPMLPWIAMAERQGPRHLVPTIIGSAVDEVLQASFTGINLFEYWDEDMFDPMDTFYSNITDVPCGGYNVRTLVGQNGLQRLYQSSMYPLKGRSGKIDRLIGIISVAKSEPLLSRFGKPKDIKTLDVAHIDYIDIGFGVPEGI